ncbi:LysR family transcriptional regulator [Corynebacterium poyangense]|uniref:LysR family transcriptional regulator n=1 Tax=Corynebacterium poyangense TaxID=2684405 RepID=A0A7H0SQ48_9CORY|nr:LysR family transcriptional regulator [Corynebacterium poyangense]MBZ8178390.1 LysR family transcriptional regulator [Corynebacterium poyangense]QNQ90673.1 LysR family transcriptional regulator [Corynebacterium poyangense]
MKRRIDTSHLECLVTFLAVARLGRYIAAGQYLGVNHTTVSRRINELEKALGGPLLLRNKNGWELSALGEKTIVVAEEAEKVLRELGSLEVGMSSPILSGLLRIAAPDAFSVHIATPALADLQRNEPNLEIEMITATQRARQRRSGMDIEIVVGKPQVNRAINQKLMDYELCLYATESFIDTWGEPQNLKDLENYPLNYYVEAGLQVDDLDSGRQALPVQTHGARGIKCTSVFGHVSATINNAGIGLLPDYVAVQYPLRRVLTKEFSHQVSYWMVVRQENTRNPRVRACVRALQKQIQFLASSK